ncbi:uncharacterized protein [Drosophila virilis]|uniref:Uncharacterized protein n=1 Tax=Drosophila virilis TaxID=7244 RepID=B4LXW6_DROVI|nr:uncharacterized protein LOC6630656 [Drosophila virilis]EDW66832.1 uncharacterized protein Dvir_GJ23813 [Drosophila virilis]
MLHTQFFVLLVLLSSSHGELRPQQTQLRSAYERVFSRRKRAVIFPPGSFFKFTCNFSNGLLSNYPRGITFQLEEAVYFPIPGTRDDLYPKRFLPKKTTTPKPLTRTTDTYVYIPGTDWRFKAQALPKPRPRPHQPNLQPPKTQRIDLDGYANPHKWQQWAKYGANQAQKWQSSANKYRLQMTNKTRWSKWTTPAPKWSANWTSHWPRLRPNAVVESRHFHGHRDRRQLFEHFSGLSARFGIDIKSCILRSICDSKRLLLPPGYSMLQDMLRIVFTMPRLDGQEDDYTRVMMKDADACAEELKTKCNMNLLIWLLSGKLDKINAVNN